MLKRIALLTIFLSMLAVGVAYASALLPGGAPGWAAWVMVVAIAAMMVSAMALGAEREGRLGRLWLPFAFVFVVLVAGFGAVLVLPPADPADPTLWFGLPPRAAIVLYGVGLLPLLAVPLSYALTFEQQTLSAEDLERVRQAAVELRAREAKARATEHDRSVSEVGA
jgi:hypothetical protein